MHPLQQLIEGHKLTAEQWASLLTAPAEVAAQLTEAARRLTERVHGKRVTVRGLLEITNCCRNNCYYCGIRCSNNDVRRYALSPEQIVQAAADVYSAGFRTIVMQGGEWPANDEMVERVVAAITSEMPDCAVTLSLGERPREVYAAWRKSGATRYLLRHETADTEHYSLLHPAEMSFAHRIDCLHSLRAEGYQVGAGMMVGTPGQGIAQLVADLMFLQEFRPEMVGIGPFIPHPATPLAHNKAGNIELTLRLISLVRLMLPAANIPSTTALATLAPDGRERGILAGANVVMPNATPAAFRADYSLYERKASSGAEAAEGLILLSDRMKAIERTLDFSRGDFNPNFDINLT